MNKLDQTTAKVARISCDALESQSIEYALGGALAHGYWGNPRGTLYVDVAVFVDVNELEKMFNCLIDAGL